MSQLDLALEAEISSRHLSFVETGRSQPSREMVLNLAERLDVPLRERNILLVSAGYAPVFAERALTDPALASVREAVDVVLKGHEPYPVLAIDRHWTLHAAVMRLIPGAAPALLRPPVNVLRLSLSPEGLAPRIANLAEWRAHLLARLRRQIELTADAALSALLNELERFPAPRAPASAANAPSLQSVVVPLRLASEMGVLSFLSTTTMFGTPIDITLSELAWQYLLELHRSGRWRRYYTEEQLTALMRHAIRNVEEWAAITGEAPAELDAEPSERREAAE